MDVVIIGASGHGMVVCDLLLTVGMHVIAFVDDDPAKQGSRVLDIPVCASLQQVASSSRPAMAMGIGNNAARRREFERWRGLGFEIVRVVHPSAVVSSRSRIGEGAVLMPNVVVNVAADVGDDVILNTGCSVDHHCVIGAHAHIAPGATLAGGVRIGEETLVGAGAVVIPGVSVGARCVLGAGAVALRNVADGVSVVGVPARQHPGPDIF
jgi:acetyltransferase EpsM